MEIKSIINNERMFTIKWRLTEWCNYRCSYCMQGNKPKKDTNPILIEKISKEINKITYKLKQQDKNIDFHLIGGKFLFMILKI